MDNSVEKFGIGGSGTSDWLKATQGVHLLAAPLSMLPVSDALQPLADQASFAAATRERFQRAIEAAHSDND